MGFIDSYKRLEKLLSDMCNDNHGVTSYINEMLNTPLGSVYVKGWDADLKQLKHYRWIRNKIVHEPGCTEENLCRPEDTRWINEFYSRVLNSTDPLALYHKAKTGRRYKRASATRLSRGGCLTYVIGMAIMITAAVLTFAFI